MSDRTGFWRNTGLLLIGLGVVGLLGLQMAVALRLEPVIEAFSDPGAILEGAVDYQLEAGFAQPTLDSDDPLLADRKILITTMMNEHTAADVTARLLYLDSLDSAAPIDLYISTQGGFADSAFTIIDTMRLIRAPVNTWAVGGCYSAGALILTAGTGRRHATENAVIMIHANLAEDTHEEYSFEGLDRSRYERVFRDTAELPEEWFPMTTDDSYYLTPMQALEFKLIDEIVTGPPDAAPGQP